MANIPASVVMALTSAPETSPASSARISEVDVVGEVHVARVDLEDLDAALVVGLGDLDEAVEAAGSEDGAVEHVEAVGGGDDPDFTALVEAVHLGEELHHRPLDLGVAGGLGVGPLGGDGVDPRR